MSQRPARGTRRHLSGRVSLRGPGNNHLSAMASGTNRFSLAATILIVLLRSSARRGNESIYFQPPFVLTPKNSLHLTSSTRNTREPSLHKHRL
ncbi:hypothetical protein BDR03DRAFT_748456 [Suillus americanus]|nr:hypothetical protein BDR03DRAFT_748456 [Suillus americanus]